MKIEYNGIELFKSFSQTVMEMTEKFRQKKDPYFVKILEDLYTGYPSEQTVQILMKLHLQKLNPKIQQEIKDKSIYIFPDTKIRTIITTNNFHIYVMNKIHSHSCILKIYI